MRLNKIKNNNLHILTWSRKFLHFHYSKLVTWNISTILFASVKVHNSICVIFNFTLFFFKRTVFVGPSGLFFALKSQINLIVHFVRPRICRYRSLSGTERKQKCRKSYVSKNQGVSWPNPWLEPPSSLSFFLLSNRQTFSIGQWSMIDTWVALCLPVVDLHGLNLS